MTDKTENFIHKPHDKFVYKMMQNSEIAKHFMQTYLPEDVLKHLDLNSLQLSATHFVDFLNNDSQADIIFRANFERRETYILLLLEHQSRIDEFMPFRILWYTLQIYQQHINANPKKNKKNLPFVYPQVLYHNQRHWHYSTDIKDYIDAPRDLVDRYFLKPFQLIDLSKIPDEEIKKDPWVAAVNLPLKHIYSDNIDDFVDSFEGVLLFFEEEIKRKYPETGEYILRYLSKNANITDMAAALGLVKSKYGEELGEKIMTLGQHLKKEGRLEHAREVAINMAELGDDIKKIALVLKISEEEVKQLLSEGAANDDSHKEDN